MDCRSWRWCFWWWICFNSNYTVVFSDVNKWQLSHRSAVHEHDISKHLLQDQKTVLSTFLCKINFSTANSFPYGLPSADSWQCDQFPLVGLRWTERSGLMLRPPSSPLPYFRGNCGHQVRILFLSDLAAAWHMTSHIHTNTHIHRYSTCAQTQLRVFTCVMSWSWVIVLIQRV